MPQGAVQFWIFLAFLVLAALLTNGGLGSEVLGLGSKVLGLGSHVPGLGSMLLGLGIVDCFKIVQNGREWPDLPRMAQKLSRNLDCGVSPTNGRAEPKTHRF